MKRFLAFLTIISLFPPPAIAAISGRTDAAGEPPIVEVHRAALRYNNLDDGEVRRWKRKARLSALLPRFELRYDRRVRNDVDININENVYVGSSGVRVGPEEGAYAQNAYCDQNVGVKATWYLGALIFNSEQLDISREARSLMQERHMLMNEVNNHYYERRRLRGIIDALERGRTVPGMKGDRAHELMLARVKLAEETAALDGLTGGWFSRRSRR